MATETFGRRIRALRQARNWSLAQLSERSSIAYTYLSRLENDSVAPGPEAVSKLAKALEADLGELLALADCLPQAILDRIVERKGRGGSAPTLRRSAGRTTWDHPSMTDTLVALMRVRGLDQREAEELARAVERLSELPPAQRSAIVTLIEGQAGNLRAE